jgi:hypothetical protein
MQDIYCNDIDENDPNDIWFIFHDKPPLKISRAAIITRQEVRPLDQKTIEKLNADGGRVRKMFRSKDLNYGV